MVERPASLAQLDRFFAAATIAHEYIADLHRELVTLGQDSERTWELLNDSASVALSQIPELTIELRRLAIEWSDQQLLDPSRAEETLALIKVELNEIEPQLSASRERQNEIAAELRERVDRARGG